MNNELIVTDCDYCGDISACKQQDGGTICRSCELHLKPSYTVTGYDESEIMGVELGSRLSYREAVKMARDAETVNDKPGKDGYPVINIEII